jgi:cobalamin biosynthesis protein CobD/CbiB
MSFRFYTNAISQASKSVAAGIFITGLLLIGFGFLIYVLKEIFAILAAIVFCVAGAGCLITAVKIFAAQRKLDKMSSEDTEGHRENVHIHIEEHYDA